MVNESTKPSPSDQQATEVEQAVQKVLGTGQQPNPPDQEQQALSKPEPDSSLTASWSAIKRAERQNTEERMRLKNQARDLQKQAEEYKNQSSQFQDIKAQLEADPVKTLESLGYSFDSIAKRVMNEPDNRVPNELRTELDGLKKQIQEFADFKTQNNRSAQIDRIHTEIKGILGQDKFSFLRANPKAEERIIELGGAYAQEHNESISLDKVAEVVQDMWRDELKSLKEAEPLKGFWESLRSPSPDPKASDTSQIKDSSETEGRSSIEKILGDLPTDVVEGFRK